MVSYFSHLRGDQRSFLTGKIALASLETGPRRQTGTRISHRYRAFGAGDRGICLDDGGDTLFEDFELMGVDLRHNIFKIDFKMINLYLNSLKVGFNVIIS